MGINECCNQDCNQGKDCPKRIKELTDEEIIEECFDVALNDDDAKINFARAILRKAQKK